MATVNVAVAVGVGVAVMQGNAARSGDPV